MVRLALLAGSALLLSTAAMAQPMAQSSGAPEPMANPTSTADASASDPDKIICRNVKPPTGTRLGSARNRQRVCQTKADWEQQEAEAQEAARNATRNGANTMPGENGPPSH
jgi:hypothetical protein